MGFISAPVDLSSPAAIGSTTPNTGSFTTLSANNTFSATGQVRLSSGTGNVSLRRGDGVTFLTANYNTFFQVQAPEFRIGHDGTGGPVSFFLGGNGIIEQRNTTNAQTFRLYNTYTDASNYERGFFRWSSNVLELGTEAAGTGTNRILKLQSAAQVDIYAFGTTQAARFSSSSIIYTALAFAGASKAGSPTTTDLAAGRAGVYKDTTAGTVALWYNDGGTMKSVALA